MRKHALILGVRDYESPMMNPVPFADADAVGLGRALEERCGFEVTVLAGAVDGSSGVPTWKSINGEFKRLTEEIGEEDDFFLGFCGHGIELDGQGLLLLPEADPEWPDAGTLPLRRIQSFLSRIAARRAFVHVDACRRDPLRGRGVGAAVLPSALSRDLKGLVQERGQWQMRSALLACSEGEQAYESDTLGHGFLTWAVLKAMRGEAWSGGRLTLSALVRHVMEEVRRQLRAHGLAGKQTPQYVQEGAAEDWVLGEETVGGGGVENRARSALAAWMAEQAIEHDRRIAEAQARAAAEAQALAGQRAELEDNWPKLKERLAAAVWTPAERRSHWRRFCGHFGLKPLSEEPGDLRWGGEGVEELLVPWVHPDGLRFLPVPAGKFSMGSAVGGEDAERPVTRVTLSRPFWVAEVPVTQALYQGWTGTNPSHFDGAGLPVESVTWDEAMDCAARAQERAVGTLPEGYELRLPTEAEWEHACRAGTTTRWSFGDDESGMEQHGWSDQNAGGTTHPVGEKLPNPWGLKDMHGGVWEWCLDWRGPYPGGRVMDPIGPGSGSGRALRGGSWFNRADDGRSAYRNFGDPSSRWSDLGFRLVLAPRLALGSRASGEVESPRVGRETGEPGRPMQFDWELETDFPGNALGIETSATERGVRGISEGAFELYSDRGLYLGASLTSCPRLESCDVTLDLERLAGPDEEWFGLEFGELERCEHFQVLLNGRGEVRLARFAGPDDWRCLAQFDSGFGPLGPGGRAQLRVVREGGVIEVRVDGRLALRASQNRVLALSLGLLAGPGVRVRFSRIQVKGRREGRTGVADPCDPEATGEGPG